MDLCSTARLRSGELPATVNLGHNGPFATIDLDSDGYAYLRLRTLADCDQVIRAGAAAKRRLEATIAGAAHAYIPGEPGAHCDTCGQLKDAAIHVGPRRPGCLCGHSGTVHHLDMVKNDLTYCNACDDCLAYVYVEDVSVTA